MPWSAVTVKDQRQEFVGLARQADANVSELCRRFGISRKTGYKWLSREDLEDRSRRPCHSPSRTAQELQDQVLAVRGEHPAWGGRKIAHVLARDAGVRIAASTVNSVLKRHGLISR
ncbi:helix-turn-helix domain-containing protein, partial [Rubrivivax benzoatilyticus]|uniref:helix-turn-helix domain-containing protein n=1 Tax=Rubrivivax benzoatilyticus TaxID=316997 RepID=UPI0011100F6E